MPGPKYYHTLPARILHWINAAAIGLLIITGLYIRDPQHFTLFANMDMARKTHFVAMYVLIYGLLIRLYYSWVSKDYRELLLRFRDIRGFPALIRYYLFISKATPDFGNYNPGQKLLYNVWVVGALLQAVSGFILYWPESFSGPARLLGGPIMVRQLHFMITWFFIVTAVLHVYLAFIGGWEIIKSMITGYLPQGVPAQPTSEGVKPEHSLTV